MTDDRSVAGRIPEAMSMRGLAGKRDYVRSLENRRDEEAMSLLIECLCDESWYLRELAEEALFRIGARSGPALVPLLDQGLWYSRASAARVLGRIGHRSAIGALVALTEDPVQTVRQEAYATLAVLAGQGGRVHLAWALQQLPPERRAERLEGLTSVDRVLAERLQRLFERDELRTATDPEGLRDDAPWVRACEEGMTWDDLPPSPPGRSTDSTNRPETAAQG
jgi:HEAT repeat protein